MVDTIPVLLPPSTPTYTSPQASYLQFIKPNGVMAVVTPDGCNCVPQLTTPVPNVVDPYTGEMGIGCQLTLAGINDLSLGASSSIYTHYRSKSTGLIPCINGGTITLTSLTIDNQL